MTSGTFHVTAWLHFDDAKTEIFVDIYRPVPKAAVAIGLHTAYLYSVIKREQEL